MEINKTFSTVCFSAIVWISTTFYRQRPNKFIDIVTNFFSLKEVIADDTLHKKKHTQLFSELRRRVELTLAFFRVAKGFSKFFQGFSKNKFYGQLLFYNLT